MAQIKGTNVAAPVVPFSTTDVHPTHLALYGQGGYRSVGTTADRDAISPDRREAGMLVWVMGTQKAWRLDDNLTTWTEVSAINQPQLLDGGSY